MKAPFPYFGGKSSVAETVWHALGQPKHFIEPFFGSGAVLLNRPNYMPDMIETVNDKDGFLANVWRSLKFSPDKTAEWADWPVNHADLSARRMKLVKSDGYLLENLVKDDEWHDPKIAGYWIWAASCWIGSGLTECGRARTITHGKRPNIAHAGEGVHGKPRIEYVGQGGRKESIYIWFKQLAERLRFVRVVCGDWTRVCSGNWQDDLGISMCP